jgi:uncharacterized protein with NRDE domain
MCTVTYIPTNNGIILTSNRDESKSRDVNHLIKYKAENKIVTFPPDNIGGTWIGCNSQNEIICLLNGAYIKHKHRPPYKHSRGLIVKSFLESNKPINTLLHDIELDGIEPFTLIYTNEEKLIELRWDERIKHIRTLNINETHIWSSSTLYDEVIQRKKTDFFQAHLSNSTSINSDTILDFHRSKPFGDGVNDIVMDRDVVATISITQIERTKEKTTLSYHNLLKNNTISSILPAPNH